MLSWFWDRCQPARIAKNGSPGKLRTRSAKIRIAKKKLAGNQRIAAGGKGEGSRQERQGTEIGQDREKWLPRETADQERKK